ncbi:MAG: transposase [Thermoanaerobaculia bacterium]
MSGLADLLDENARLRRELAALQGRLQSTEVRLESTQGELTEARAELVSREALLEEVRLRAEYLAHQLGLAQLRRAGPASQRYVAEGQSLLPFDVDIVPPPRAPVAEPQSDQDPAEPLRKRGNGKPRRRNRDDFAHLAARPVHCPAAEASCPSCGGALRTIGTTTSFRIEWVPGHFERHDITRDKCACPNCPGQGVLTASGPCALDKALAGNGLVARIIVDKIADHIPGNRQVRRMAREGFEVGSQTVSAWICAAAGVLRVVAEAIRADILPAAGCEGCILVSKSTHQGYHSHTIREIR